ncbi:MAG: peptide deformylase [Defluviitaleaceae bacterium]|nr:peptide deformylase [Defluviitaleaceae bacterium]
MKDFIYDGHPLLRTVVNEVKLPLGTEDKETMQKMLAYLRNSQDPKLVKKYKLKEGVGLAAPQIGLNKRIFAVRTEDEQGQLHEYVLANPKLVSHSEALTYLSKGEGCLSVKQDIPGIVPRYDRIKLTGYNIEGDLVEIKAKGYLGIVFQHEIDHLNGKMFYDHIDKNHPLMPPPGAVAIE